MELEPSQEYKEKLNRLYTAKEYSRALELVLKEEKIRSSAADILYSKALLLGMLDKYEESIEVADQAILKNPHSPAIYNLKGVHLYYLKRYDEAILAFDACLKLDPSLFVSLQKKIFSLIFLGKFREAIITYEEADFPEFYEEIWFNNLGYAYLMTGEYHKAGTFFYGAKALNPYMPIVYRNLALVWRNLKDPIRSIKHYIAFITLAVLEKLNLLKKIKPSFFSKIRPHISEAKFFLDSGRLFKTKNQEREIRAILKLLRGPSLTALCNNTWNWFAVNIPYHAVEKNDFNGDIDILLKRPRYLDDYDAGFSYRGFQVKTVLVDKDGKTRSLKRGKRKHKDIKKQLDVLKDFGCEQVFLLEIYVLERGFSSNNVFPSAEIIQEIAEKASSIQGGGFGYAITIEEPSQTHDDETGGIMYTIQNILPAKNFPLKPVFKTLVDAIDEFVTETTKSEKFKKLTGQGREGIHPSYCKFCKKLTMLIPKSPILHICMFCEKKPY
jgi:tetratricopeptide (TPR) repeat protein